MLLKKQREERICWPAFAENRSFKYYRSHSKSFMDVREYADSLLQGSAVMISFEAVDVEVKNRILIISMA